MTARSEQLFRELNDKPNLALELQLHGLAAIDQKDYTTARQSLEAGLALAMEIKDAERTAHVNNYLGDVARGEQDYARAQKAYEASLRLFREDDKVVTLISVRGTNTGPFMGMPPTGKSATWSFIDIFRIADGKIIEHWSETDSMVLMQQLGLVPPPPG